MVNIDEGAEVARALVDVPRSGGIRTMAARFGMPACAAALLAEIAWRCRPPAGCAPFAVTFRFGPPAHDATAATILVDALGAAVTEAVPDAGVLIDTDLAELWHAVYGRPDLPVAVQLPATTGVASDITAWRRCFPSQEDLSALAVRYRSDKWGFHWYTPRYEQHFAPMRHQPVRLLEIGVGGYEDESGGGSLLMWKDYFPRGLIHGLDLYDKSALAQPRLEIFQGDQSDPATLARVAERAGALDIVIDDGSHINEDVLASFHHLFPLLRPGGLYVVEDTQTSYWPGYGGDSEHLDDPRTTMGYLKTLTDGLNYEEFMRPGGYAATETERTVVATHFYHNLVVIEKGHNAEGTVPDYVPRSSRAYLNRSA